MLKFIVHRFLQAVLVIFAIISLTFFMIHAAPGGPFSQERKVSPEILEKLNEHYGLNDPLLMQYANYLKGLARFDFGPSYRYENSTVSELIANSFPVSLQLGLLALLVALILGVPAGVLAAVKKNTVLDYAPMSAAMAGICLPTFVMGPLLALIFGLWLGQFNVAGWSEPSDRVLPSLTLGLFYAAYVARLTRGGMLEVLSQDFIRTARSKGLSEKRIVFFHALKGGLLPVISFLGPAIAGLITGSFVVETIFNIPGLGRHFINAAFNRDYTLILGTVIFYGTLIIVMNLLVDILMVALNPRLKYD